MKLRIVQFTLLITLGIFLAIVGIKSCISSPVAETHLIPETCDDSFSLECIPYFPLALGTAMGSFIGVGIFIYVPIYALSWIFGLHNSKTESKEEKEEQDD